MIRLPCADIHRSTSLYQLIRCHKCRYNCKDSDELNDFQLAVSKEDAKQRKACFIKARNWLQRIQSSIIQAEILTFALEGLSIHELHS